MRADPVGEVRAKSFRHLGVHMGQVEDVLDAVLSVFGVEGSSLEQVGMSFFPKLMEPVLIPVYAMGSVVLVQDLV